MPESDTLLVFKILAVLARAGAQNHPLALHQIAEAMRMKDQQAQHYLTVLDKVGVVRAEDSSLQSTRYSLTHYGLKRLETAGRGVAVSDDMHGEP
jgi:DNA-binding IclR family transcriptional regulator